MTERPRSVGGSNHRAQSAKVNDGGDKKWKMHAVQVWQAGGPLKLVERDVPEPGAGAVRVKVEACGICHSDSYTKDGIVPCIEYPQVPGHEVIGHVDAVGANVREWAPGQRVGTANPNPAAVEIAAFTAHGRPRLIWLRRDGARLSTDMLGTWIAWEWVLVSARAKRRSQTSGP